MPQLKEKVFTLKSTPQALRCRNEILDRLERASITESDEERRQLLSFVVVGGGPTGVEIAGAIGEMKRYVVKREYPSLKTFGTERHHYRGISENSRSHERDFVTQSRKIPVGSHGHCENRSGHDRL